MPLNKIPICPKCRFHHPGQYVELRRMARRVYPATVSGLPTRDYEESGMGEPYAVIATCCDPTCEHQWRLRGVECIEDVQRIPANLTP